MKTKLKSMLILFTIFSLLGTIQAQVTIGMDEAPLNGTLLQLKTEKDAVSKGNNNATQGLGLPRVLLNSLTTIAGDNDDLKATIDNTLGAAWDKTQHIGLLVYNVAERVGRDGSIICSGVYAWHGDKWYRLPKPCDGSSTCTPITQVGIGSGSNYSSGDKIILSITAITPSNASTPITYRWYKDGTALSDNGGISGATTNQLTISSAVVGDAGNYTVKLSNGCSSDIQSNTIVLTVQAGPSFSPNYNVTTGTTTLNSKGSFIAGTGDDKSRGTGINYPSKNVGVFHYTNGNGRSIGPITFTAKGITVTVPAQTLTNGEGELLVDVSGTPDASTAGKAFDIPITVLGQQLYVRVTVGCGAYNSAPSITNGQPAPVDDGAWIQWQCFNLGANTNIDPLTPDARLHGDVYKFGAKNPSLSMSYVQAQIGATISNWTSLYPTQASGTGNWSTNNNPCPAGWRIPNSNDWGTMGFFNQDLNSTGTWMLKNGQEGLRLGEALFLPSTGSVNSDGNDGKIRGTNYQLTTYWTPERESDGADRYANIFTDRILTTSGDQHLAFPVRCIATSSE